MILHVILACHNRKKLTVRALKLAAHAAQVAGVEAHFTLYDDGSTDGTSGAVKSLGLPLTVIQGDGSAFWAKSMAIAERHILVNAGADDYVVWLNDDVAVDSDSIARALPSLRNSRNCLHVASTRDPISGEITYGGYRRLSVIQPLKLELVPPSTKEVLIDSLNGNLVFVPVPLARRIGGIDGSFAHAGADTDYGYRASRAGADVVLLPGTFGACSRNTPFRGTVWDEWKHLISPKGPAHPGTTAKVLRKHGLPMLWPIAWASTYILWWLRRPWKRRT